MPKTPRITALYERLSRDLSFAQIVVQRNQSQSKRTFGHVPLAEPPVFLQSSALNAAQNARMP